MIRYGWLLEIYSMREAEDRKWNWVGSHPTSYSSYGIGKC